ncbi:MAG: DUF1398 family protein [Bacillota bacterium]
MEAENTKDASDFSFTSRMAFSSLIMTLEKMGVESYHVDMAQQSTCYQMLNGEVMSESFYFDGKIAQDFDDGEIRSAILDIKQNHLEYKEFLKRIMNAGIVNYVIYLKGRKIIFYGRNGDSYIENFPLLKLNQH